MRNRRFKAGQIIVEYFLIGTTMTLITFNAIKAMQDCAQNAENNAGRQTSWACQIRTSMERLVNMAGMGIARKTKK